MGLPKNIMRDDAAFAGLVPAGLWLHFSAITRIPRPSRHEQQISTYVRSWANKLGYPVLSDAAGNLCVHVPGHPRRVNSPVVILQGHLDMVCERDSSSLYDAERGDIHVIKDGDWISAEGTTLGADNGIGVAAMLHLAEDPDIVHGPLDLLFTVDEETGLTGAQSLDPRILRGSTLLNLDNEDDDQLCVGCAGSSDATVIIQRPRTPTPAAWIGLQAEISGLLGGHSGVDIAKPRLNAIRALARLLQCVSIKGIELRLVMLNGGNKRNAIPREASAVFFIPAKFEATVRSVITHEADQLRRQYAGVDDGFEVRFDLVESEETGAWSVEDSRCLSDLLISIPCGVLAMSSAVSGLVETSNSIGTIETDGDVFRIGCLIRSSLDTAKRDVMNTICSVARLAGADVEGIVGYPGWQPDLNSHALEVARAAFLRLFDHEPLITAVHAGLECGILGEKLPGIDMVSLGPHIKGPHAPGEKVHVGSVERFWQLLVAVLDDISR